MATANIIVCWYHSVETFVPTVQSKTFDVYNEHHIMTMMSTQWKSEQRNERKKMNTNQFSLNVAECDVHYVVLKCDKIHVSCHRVNVNRCCITHHRPMIKSLHYVMCLLHTETYGRGGIPAAAPPPFRPNNPVLCGSHPLFTPYYCRLGDLLCFVFIVSNYCMFFY